MKYSVFFVLFLILLLIAFKIIIKVVKDDFGFSEYDFHKNPKEASAQLVRNMFSFNKESVNQEAWSHNLDMTYKQDLINAKSLDLTG